MIALVAMHGVRLVGLLLCGAMACSAGAASSEPDPQPGSQAGTGGAGAGGGGTVPAGGASGQGGSSTSGASGASGSSSSLAGTSGSGGSLGGDAGAPGAAGVGGAATSCTPGTGTTEIAEGVIRDNATCLDWEKTPGFVGQGNFSASREYCEDLVLGGFDDFRMPSVEELASSGVAWLGRLATAPRYTASGAPDETTFHYCGVTHWSAENALGCNWVGPSNSDGTLCVRGSAGVPLSPPQDCGCEDGSEGFVSVSE